MSVCPVCKGSGVVEDVPKRNKVRPDVEARHERMMELWEAGLTQSEIGDHVGRTRTTVVHHINRKCRCEFPSTVSG